MNILQLYKQAIDRRRDPVTVYLWKKPKIGETFVWEPYTNLRVGEKIALRRPQGGTPQTQIPIYGWAVAVRNCGKGQWQFRRVS